MLRKKYTNIDNIENNKKFSDVWKWRREAKNLQKDLTDLIPQAADKQIAFMQNNTVQPTITWVGHATFLIQLGGVNILTDPVWALKMGFRPRITQPGLTIKELPEINIVLISHGHYDHLDFPTLRQLKGEPTYLVPVGFKNLFLRKGLKNVEELTWWDNRTFDQLQFTFVPAQHWTRRGLFDLNTSHWGGWVIKNADQQVCIYFVGDSGNFSGFQEIGKKFSIDYLLMPIGAYEPEWFMSESHINPDDAVKAYLELEAENFIPMHYGTYDLSDDTGSKALERLIKAWNEKRLDSSKLLILQLGETIHLSDDNNNGPNRHDYARGNIDED